MKLIKYSKSFHLFEKNSTTEIHYTYNKMKIVANYHIAIDYSARSFGPILVPKQQKIQNIFIKHCIFQLFKIKQKYSTGLVIDCLSTVGLSYDYAIDWHRKKREYNQREVVGKPIYQRCYSKLNLFVGLIIFIL